MECRHSRLPRRVAMTVKWAGALLILMLSTPRAEATPIVVLTSGTLYSDRTMPFADEHKRRARRSRLPAGVTL